MFSVYKIQLDSKLEGHRNKIVDLLMAGKSKSTISKQNGVEKLLEKLLENGRHTRPLIISLDLGLRTRSLPMGSNMRHHENGEEKSHDYTRGTKK